MAPKVKLNLKDRLEDGELDLSLTDLQEVPVKEIAAVKKVTSLDLSNNRLTNLGKNFITLTTIIKLDLSKNQLTELPDDFGSMKQLRHLDLYSNELKHLPLSFYQLKSLKWLDLKNNPLVPAVAKIAGPCIDAGQCVKCAKDVVAFFSQLHEDVELEKQKREQTKQLELQAELEHQKQVQKKKDKKKAAKAKKNKTKLDNKTEEIDPIQIQQVPKTPPLKKEQIQKTKTSSYSGVLFKLVLFTFITAFLLSTTKQELGLYVKQTTVVKWDSLQRNLPDTLQPWALSFERNIHTIHNVTGLYMDTMVKYVNDISNGPVMHRFSTGLQHILKTTLKESERFYYFVSDKCNFIVNEIKNKIN